MIIAQMNPAFESVAQSATALVATCVIVTAVLVPILTAIYSKKYSVKKEITVDSVQAKTRSA
ncbi:2-keto-3-deoxygluconate permease [compost metagenome]